MAVKPYLKLRYQFTTDTLPPMDEPFILLSNHTTEDDMFFTGTAVRGHMYFVCGEHLLRNRLYGGLLRNLVDPIPLPKGSGSLRAVREILRRIKAGHNICIFHEGKRSYHGETIPCSEATGKLVKMAGCALVTYRIRGGYFTYPRWARQHHRKGHAEGQIVGIYSSRELAGLSAKEITDIINRDTYENAYETQRREHWRYRGKNLAEGMEHVLFLCPRCHSMDSIRTEGDAFSCTSCGMRGTYNEYGFLEGDDLPYDDVLSWMRWIETAFDARVQESEEDAELFAEEDVLLYQMLDGYRNEDIATANLTICRDRMEFAAEEARAFAWKDITDLSVLYGNILLFTHKGTYYGMTGHRFHAWKCARLWHLYKGDTSDPSKEI